MRWPKFGGEFHDTTCAGVVQNLDDRISNFRPADRPLHRYRKLRKRHQCDKLSYRWGRAKRPHPGRKGVTKHAPLEVIANCEGLPIVHNVDNGTAGSRAVTRCALRPASEIRTPELATICRILPSCLHSYRKLRILGVVPTWDNSTQNHRPAGPARISTRYACKSSHARRGA